MHRQLANGGPNCHSSLAISRARRDVIGKKRKKRRKIELRYLRTQAGKGCISPFIWPSCGGLIMALLLLPHCLNSDRSYHISSDFNLIFRCTPAGDVRVCVGAPHVCIWLYLYLKCVCLAAFMPHLIAAVDSIRLTACQIVIKKIYYRPKAGG